MYLERIESQNIRAGKALLIFLLNLELLVQCLLPVVSIRFFFNPWNFFLKWNLM